MHEVSFYPLLIVLSLAFIVPLILSRYRSFSVPAVVGEIVAGMIVGESGLNIISEGPLLDMLSALGFVFLMFLAGLELDFRLLFSGGSGNDSRSNRFSSPLSLGVVSFGITLLLSFAVAQLMVSWGMASSPWIMTLILGTTSLGIVLPVLRERGISSRPYGQALLVAALIADFATILLVSVYAIVRSSGLSVQILSVFVLAGIFVLVYAALTHGRLSRRGVFASIAEAAGHLSVRAAFALALFFVAASESLGVEVILGAFMAGALLSLVRPEKGWDLHEKLEVLGYGFLVPVFFVTVGVRFNLSALLESSTALALVPVLLLAAYLVKLLPSLVFRLAYDWRRTFGAAFLLSSRLSLIIAISQIGLQWGIISPATNSAIILVAIVTCTLSPMLFTSLVPCDFRRANRIIVLGSGREARKTARRLQDRGEIVTVLTNDAVGADELRKRNLDVVVANPTTIEGLQKARLEEAKAIVAMLEDEKMNLAAVEKACGRFQAVPVYAMVQDEEHAPTFRACGARIIDYDLSPFWILETLLKRSSIFDLIVRGEETGSDSEVAEVRLNNQSLVGKALRDIQLPNGALIIAIRRGEDFVIPRGPTRLQVGDVLTLAGDHTAVHESIGILGE